MVPTNDGGHIPAMYGNFVEILRKAEGQTLPPDQSMVN